MISYHSFSEKIQQLENQQIPFVIFKKPNSETLHAFFQNSDMLFSDFNFDEKGFVMHSFSGEKKFLIKNEQHIFTTIEKQSFTYNQVEAPYSEAEKNRYKNLTKQAISEIETQNLSKVVLSRNVIFSIQKKSLFAYFQRLIHWYPSAFCYIVSLPRVGTWLAATPEILVEINGDTLNTMSLAGTQLAQNEELPSWAEKEEKEQEIVTNMIINTLLPLTESLFVKRRQNLKAGNLWHLCSLITAKIPKQTSVNQLISSLHPTPAVCGFPTEKAYDFIAKNESYNREFYTGYCGLLNFEEKTNLFVNLRCAQLIDNKAIIYVGGGINQGSNPENEWLETQNKAQTMLKVFYSV